ncbi:hypothetical protein KIL84_008431 [Mauremys mutica]|uniref:Uncharacterized protein n=1 Tax=Mauremys mutica TaxID=74926 RepID=A0A9D4ATE5_9SAUR|nr:hypothetical protein KIL84_008431 [Mauremys mutica]
MRSFKVSEKPCIASGTKEEGKDHGLHCQSLMKRLTGNTTNQPVRESMQLKHGLRWKQMTNLSPFSGAARRKQGWLAYDLKTSMWMRSINKMKEFGSWTDF